MDQTVIKLIYFEKRPWYGACLAGDILNRSSSSVVVQSTTADRVAAVGPEDDIVLMSFVSSRGFPRIFTAFKHLRLRAFREDRFSSGPLVIAGGAACFSPEPIADLVDIICVGDGEEMLSALPDILQKEKMKEGRRRAIAELPGAYDPAARSFEYDETGIFVQNADGDTSPIVPHTTDRWDPPPYIPDRQPQLELARGCTNSCLMCALSWRRSYRERPEEQARKILEEYEEMDLFTPNLGSVSYYQDIVKHRGKHTTGDIAVADFLKLPYPSVGDYEGFTMTFGIEGITPRLRRLIGKPISPEKIEETQERLITGKVARQQLYFIRGIPGESEDDWREFNAWIRAMRPRWEEAWIPTELQFTPLTKQPHTPMQFFAHLYNNGSETAVKRLMDDAREAKKENPDTSLIYITPSRRQPSWLIDTILECGSRKTTKFAWAVHKGLLRDLSSDAGIGRGVERVKGVARKAGIDPDAILSDWDFDTVLPWSHIQPGGDKGRDRMFKAARSIKRRLPLL